MAIPTRHRVGDVFCMASRRSTMTSHKFLTDKPDNKQTSHKDKQTSREHVPDRTDCFFLFHHTADSRTQHLPSQHHNHAHHPEGERSHRIHGSCPGYCREERGCYRTLLDELITTDIPGYRNFTRMKPAFFYLIEERITPNLRKSITNFRKPLEVGLKLAVTLRHLSTGESYTSLQYH